MRSDVRYVFSGEGVALGLRDPDLRQRVEQQHPREIGIEERPRLRPFVRRHLHRDFQRRVQEREGTRVDQARKQEIVDSGAEVLVTGCPECKMMLNSAAPRTVDIAEFLAG